MIGLQNLFMVCVYALGILIVICLMVVIFDATIYTLRKAHSARKLDRLIRNKIAKGEFYAVGKSELDRMEKEETDS